MNSDPHQQTAGNREPQANVRFASLAVFFGSFLLFAVQPMLGRTLLPSFGGSAAVWTVCLASFQTLLLLGYLYAHSISRRPPKTQVMVHRLILLLAVFWTAAFAWLRPALMERLGSSSSPRIEVLFCVLLIVGIPYVMLAAGSTLIQAWLARSGTRDVYRLYAVSNLGSFFGLLAYPFVLEPYVSVSRQWGGLAGMLLLYVILLWLSIRGYEAGSKYVRIEWQADDDGIPEKNSGSGKNRPLLWFTLPALSVFLLNAVTCYLTLDVIPLPLLWVILLGLFLFSYVVGFSGWAHRFLPVLLGLSLASVLVSSYGLSKAGQPGSFELNLISAASLCLFGCTFVHAWLYQLRPAVERLSFYYLCNAAGGAIGGLFASLAIPLLFKTVAEFPIAMGGILIVALVYLASSIHSKALRWVGVVVSIGALILVFWAALPTDEDRPVIWRDRGFYGTLKVTEMKAKAGDSEGVVHEFVHGSTVHGIQGLIPGRERNPTAYFMPEKMGFGVVAHPKFRNGEPMRVNLVGLGIGTMLAYAREQDYYRCYEISPQVIDVAENPDLFTYVSGCPGRVDLVCKDARKGLEEELRAGVEPYDVIVIDAFSGDSLPYHLSTREAFELYFKMLKPDGVLALNVTNWHLDLAPYVKSIGVSFQCPTVMLESPDDLSRLAFTARCAFFCREPAELGPPPLGARLVDIQALPDFPLPTDEKGSFLKFIRW